MIIKKVETFYGGPAGRKTHILGAVAVQATFLPASTHEPHQICGKGVFGSPNFKPKY